MPQDSLVEVVNTLSPEEQAVVREFIEFLKRKPTTPASPFLSAVDEFVNEHPELLHRLAQ
jgi:hypothetical protein